MIVAVMIDCSRIGELAAQVMETISQEYDGEDGSTVRTVAIVVEIDRGESTALIIQSSEDRRWALQAFLDTAATWIEEQAFARRQQDDGEEE